MSAFVPLSSQLGIAGTSYRLQLVKSVMPWAARILKGNDAVAIDLIQRAERQLDRGFRHARNRDPEHQPVPDNENRAVSDQGSTSERATHERKGWHSAPTQAAPAAAPVEASERPPVADADTESEEDQRASYRVVARAQQDSAPAQSQPAPRVEAPKGGADTVIIGKGRQLKPIPSADAAASPQLLHRRRLPQGIEIHSR